MGRYQAKVIAGYETGLQLNKKPFLLPEDAFETLFNAYVWRNETRVKSSHKLLGRLRRSLTGESWTAATASTTYSHTISFSEPNAELTPGTLTINMPGGVVIDDDGDGSLSQSAGSPTLEESNSYIVYQTGEVFLTFDSNLTSGAVTADYSYYPNLPVMGLPVREQSDLVQEQLVAFDQKYAYTYSSGSQLFSEMTSTISTTWSGNNNQFFDSENYLNSFWVSNNTQGPHGYSISNLQQDTPSGDATITIGAHSISSGDFVQIINMTGTSDFETAFNAQTFEVKNTTGTEIIVDDSMNTGSYTSGGFVLTTKISNGSGDGLRYYNASSWYNFQPAINQDEALVGARFLVAYRDHLIAFNTWESEGGANPVQHANRARWSQNGTPYTLLPDNSPGYDYTAEADAWRDDIPGRGDFLDAPTSEHIVGYGFIRDTLYIMFERSTWRLRYTGNDYLPFEWDRLNIELGSTSQFSTIRMDTGLFFNSTRGMNFCNGQGVTRIDDKIPDISFKFHFENAGPERVHGLRDYRRKILYWTYPQADINGTFPNRLLIFNYDNQSWAVFGDSFTALGYYYDSEDDLWINDDGDWIDDHTLWDTPPSQALYETPVAGNQQGFVVELQEPDGELQARTITAIDGTVTPVKITSPNHNLEPGQYILIKDCVQKNTSGFTGVEALNGNIYVVEADESDPDNDFRLLKKTEDFEPEIEVSISNADYAGAGVIEPVDNFFIRTKAFNPQLKEGVETRIGYTDFYLTNSGGGRFKVNIYAEGQTSDPVNKPDDENTLQNRVESFPNDLQVVPVRRVWNTLYNSTQGSFFQYELTLGAEELSDKNIARSDVNLHAMVLWTEPAGRRLS